MAQMQTPVEKARSVLAELRHLMENSEGPWTWDEDLAASLPEIMEALQVADLVLGKTEVVPTGR